MALNRARLVGKRSDENGFIHLDVEFFDSAAPTVTLAAYSEAFPPGTTKADAVVAIRAAGRQRRDARAATQPVLDQIADREEVSVP